MIRVLIFPIFSETLAVNQAPKIAINCIISILSIRPRNFSFSPHNISCSPKYVAIRIIVCKAQLKVKKAIKNFLTEMSLIKIFQTSLSSRNPLKIIDFLKASFLLTSFKFSGKW